MIHNRLTHTLKVEQMGRRTAQYLCHTTSETILTKAGGLDPDVVAAAGAAHDLGHPPFGHIAESELQRILTDGSAGQTLLPDSFEGNAQTFRIVAKLAIRKPDPDDEGGATPDHLGLDLTLATLAAILKYPWCNGEHENRGAPPEAADYYSRKWGAYESEREVLEHALTIIPDGRFRSLEAEVMDYADDVTYAVHDIEDFFRMGILPLHEIALGVVGEKSKVFDDFWDFACAEVNAKGEVEFNPATARERLRRLSPLMPDLPYQDTDADRLNLHRFISSAVATLQEGLRITPAGHFLEDTGGRMLVEILKQLTWYFVIEHPALAAVQQGQRRLIADLIDWLTDWVNENDPRPVHELQRKRKIERRRQRELPARLISYLAMSELDARRQEHPYGSAQSVRRAAVDYVSSLTEPAAYELHRSLGGNEPASLIFGTLLR
jgi:dGTPase